MLSGCPRMKRATEKKNSLYTMNQITIIGFTGSAAEAHYTKNGTLIVTLSVATKEAWKDPDGG